MSYQAIKRPLVLLAWLVVVYLLVYLILVEVDFIPSVNVFVKRKAVLIGCLVILIMLITKKIFFSPFIERFIFIVTSLLLFGLLLDKFFFYTDFKQKEVKKLTSTVSLIETENPGFILCVKRYSIVKKNILFTKQLCNIGCNDFQLKEIGKDSLEVIKIRKPLLAWETDIKDTIYLKLN